MKNVKIGKYEYIVTPKNFRKWSKEEYTKVMNNIDYIIKNSEHVDNNVGDDFIVVDVSDFLGRTGSIELDLVE